jgi:hypothetical protein
MKWLMGQRGDGDIADPAHRRKAESAAAKKQ